MTPSRSERRPLEPGVHHLRCGNPRCPVSHLLVTVRPPRHPAPLRGTDLTTCPGCAGPLAVTEIAELPEDSPR